MNKRDFLKGGAALSLTPALMPTLASAATAVVAPVAQVAATLPTPSYVYDSARRIMTLHRHDATTRTMHAYLARG